MVERLARWSGPLALVGGAVFVGFVVLLSVGGDISAYPLVVALLGAASAGVAARHWAALNILGRGAAVLAIIGATLVLLVWLVGAPASGLWTVFAIAFLVFFVGNIGLAAATFAAHHIAVALIVTGALVAVVLILVKPEDASRVVALPVSLFGVGWMLIGWDLARAQAQTREKAIHR